MMSELFLFCVNRVIPAGWLILAVLLLHLIPRLPKRVFPVLWGIVGLRLLLPIRLESIVSLIPSAQPVPPDIMTAAYPAVDSGIGVLNDAVNPVLTAAFSPNAADSINPLQVWIPVFSVIWLCGCAGMLLYLLVSDLLLRRRLRFAVCLRASLWQSEQVSSPFVFGVVRPRIFLPFSMTEDEIAAVEAHETAHIRRHDPLSKLIGFLLLSVFWFQPLLWIAYHVFCRDIELACDESAVLSLSADERAAYSDALLACSVQSSGKRPVCPLAFGEIGVKSRVKNILSYKKPALWVIILCIVLCAAFAVCFLTNPPGTLPGSAKPFGHVYRIAEAVYRAPAEKAEPFPYYMLSSDGTLSVPSGTEQNAWAQVGRFRKMTLTKKNFDDRFTLWENPDSFVEDAARLRENTAHAWQLDGKDNASYCLLELSDGRLYLTFGYKNVDSVDGWGSPIRCVYRLEREEIVSCTVENGGNVSAAAALYRPQTSGFDYEALPGLVCTDVLGSMRITGSAADSPDSIRVSEDYYKVLSPEAVTVDKMTYTLYREKDGSYLLPLTHRNPKFSEHANYYILYSGKRYIIRVDFPSVSAEYNGLAEPVSADSAASVPVEMLTAVSGGETVFLYNETAAFSPETIPVLRIEPDADSTGPFDLFLNGENCPGAFYTVRDAESGETLPFFLPSGLAQQTYLFQHAVPGRRYLVTVRFSADPGAPSYRFYADIP